MTSADTETAAADTAEPDGVSEMLERREQRKARRRGRKPRTLPEPRHPRPPGKDAKTDEADVTEDVTASVAESATETTEPQSESVTQGESDERGHAASGRDLEEPEPHPKAAEAPAAAPEPAGGHSVTGQDVSVPPGATGTAKAASDAALSWAAAARKQALRLDGLATAVSRARGEGVPPLVLSAALADAEYRAGVSLPSEVWAAAEVDHG